MTVKRFIVWQSFQYPLRKMVNTIILHPSLIQGVYQTLCW